MVDTMKNTRIMIQTYGSLNAEFAHELLHIQDNVQPKQCHRQQNKYNKWLACISINNGAIIDNYIFIHHFT